METALNGVRVLDHTRVLAGPYCSMILADLGAEVIKIEPPMPTGREKGEALRPGAPQDVLTYKGQGTIWYSTNRNKKSLMLNLRSDRGREIFYDLVRNSDVSLDNFSGPDVLERLRIDYETLRKINPRIVCASVNGYGATGTYNNRAGMDTVACATAGLMRLIGDPDIETFPLRAGFNIADLVGGMFTAHGVMAAIYQRESTGKGQMVDISMADSVVSILSREFSLWLNKGFLVGKSGSGQLWGTPNQVFKASDGYVAIAGVNHFDDFCRVIGREDLATDQRFADNGDRWENREELQGIVKTVFPGKTVAEWVGLLEAAGIPCSHPQILSRDMVVEVDDGLGGTVKIVGNPIKMSATPEAEAKRFFAACPPGKHTDEVLAGVLGYSKEQVDKLVEEGAVGRMAEAKN
jgi:crotonobetainyl-CoA:carnitine CoA-transferase CaiB-like acyl-CoA transferase